MKKIIALLTVFLLTVSVSTGVVLGAAVEQEFLTDGTFTSNEHGWRALEGTPTLSQDVPEGVAGQSLLMHGDAVTISRDIYNLVPGATYTLTFWAKSEATESGTHTLQMNWNTTNYMGVANEDFTAFTGYKSASNIQETTIGGWSEFTYTISSLPQDTHYLNITFSLRYGSAYLAGMSLKGAGYPKVGDYEFIPNGGFEDGEGTIDNWSVTRTGSNLVTEGTSYIRTPNASLLLPSGGTKLVNVTANASTHRLAANSDTPMEGIIGGMSYDFSFWLQTGNKDKAATDATATCTFLDSAGQSLESKVLAVNCSKATEWRPYTMHLTAPANAAKVTVVISVEKSTYIDNVSFTGDRRPIKEDIPAEGVNLLNNGSFETLSNDMPVEWDLQNVIADAAVQTSGGFDGTNYISLAGSAGRSVLSNPVKIRAGEGYRITAYVKTGTASAAKLAAVLPSGTVEKTVTEAYPEWSMVSLAFTAGARDTSVQVQFSSLVENALISLDNVVLSSYGERVQNGDFETLNEGVLADWNLQDDAEVITEGAYAGNAISVPYTQSVASTTVSGLKSDTTYKITMKVKSNVDRAANVEIDAVGKENDTDKDAALYNQRADGEVFFKSTGGAWKTVSFNYTVPTEVTEITLKLCAGEEDETLTYDAVSMKEATNLFSNGEGESVGLELGQEAKPLASTRTLSAANLERVEYIWEEASNQNVWKFTQTGAQTSGTGKTIEPMCDWSIATKEDTLYKLTFLLKAEFTSDASGAIITNASNNSTRVYLNSETLLGTIKGTGSYTEQTYYFTGKPGTKETSIRLRGVASANWTRFFYLKDVVVEELKTEIGFYNTDGEAVQNLTGGETLRAWLTQPSASTEGESVQFTLALYKIYPDNSKQLIDMSVTTGKASLTTPAELMVDIDVPDDGGTYIAKAIPWETLTNLRALGKGAFID